MKTLVFCLLAALAIPNSARAQEAPAVIPLWEKGAPGFESRRDEPEKVENSRVSNVHNPSLTVYLPAEGKANGTALVIAPGGGHRYLTVQGEGRGPAEYLAGLGVTCFVLKYRLAREEGSPYKLETVAPEDGHRAVRIVRSLADKYHIDPRRVGIAGFSAGGEVVSYIAYDGAEGDPQATDPVERMNGRPDFQILVYPGGHGIPEAVTKDAIPLLMVVSNDDTSHVLPVLDLMNKYRAAGAPVELHLLAGGGHGFGMGERSKLTAVQHWSERMGDWLADQGLLTPAHGK